MIAKHFFSFRTLGAGFFSLVFCLNVLAAETGRTGKDVTVDYRQGGMWQPHEIADLHADTLRQMGLELDASLFKDPMQFPLSAIVWLGFCSASFISKYGLVATNYHCVKKFLQYNTRKGGPDYLKDGFVKMPNNEELSTGPAGRIYVTQNITDVSERLLKGTDGIANDQERFLEIQRRQRALIQECESAKKNVRCDVVKYYGGAKYILIEKMEILDVRLVYAPARSVGEFGGDEDNWEFPRHAGDFSILRAYVAPNGESAPYSKENVPYEPKAHLQISTEGVSEGDMVFILGYPGRTNRLNTYAQMKEIYEWELPGTIDRFTQHMALLTQLSKGNRELEVKVANSYARMENYLKNYKGKKEGIEREKLLQKKEAAERALVEWINADPARKQKYGEILEKINADWVALRATRDQDAALRNIRDQSILMSSAFKIVRMAHERHRPDFDRKEGFQKRDIKKTRDEMEQSQADYDPAIDQAVLKLHVMRALQLPVDQRPAFLVDLLGVGPITEKLVDEKLSAVFAHTEMGNKEKRSELFDSAETKDLEASSDSFIKLALAMMPYIEEIENREEKSQGVLAILQPKYMAALRELNNNILASDANSTLRMTFGRIMGHKYTADGSMLYPFTGVGGMLEKVERKKLEFPFDAPENVLAAARSKEFGPYADKQLGDLPIDWISDLDITGGNSGSATMNKRGQLVGFAFDGLYQAVASDLVFMPNINRTVTADVRYMLWNLDRVHGASALLRELGIEPAFPDQGEYKATCQGALE